MACLSAVAFSFAAAPVLAMSDAGTGDAGFAADARAQEPVGVDSGSDVPRDERDDFRRDADSPTGGALSPPTAVDLPAIELPPDAPPLTATIEVGALLTIDPQGGVAAAEISRSGGAELDRAVLAGVRRFRFHPATREGVAIAVRLPFTQRFEPPPPPPPELALALAHPERDAVIVGIVVTRGTRRAVPEATVVAIDAPTGETEIALTDATGIFQLPVRSGRDLEIRVSAPDHERFVQKERLDPHQRLEVKYLLEQQSYSRYESFVRAPVERTEVSRTQLSGPEITRVPGTFGDPFRVINLLPGVTSAMGLLPLPIVRGSSPGNTGILLDGVRLPLLFHLLAGPSVVHPELIDHVDFYPGGFPVTYGGYTGGIVDGVTRPARPDERRIDVDLNLTQSGGLVRAPLPGPGSGMTATLAGRIGYPGLILGLLAPDVSLSYWDYQARIDGGRGANHFVVFAYGANDDLARRPASGEPLARVATFGFHRLDLRYEHGDARAGELYRVVFGYDRSELGSGAGNGPITGDSGLGNGTWSANPQVRVHRAVRPAIDFTLGIESYAHTINNLAVGTVTSPVGMQIASVFNPSGFFSQSGAFAEMAWKPTPRLRVLPGVRGDLYDERQGSTSVTQKSLDPRLLARYRLTDPEHGSVFVKGVIGRYHQPPRLFFPIPGLDASSLNLGLLASTQYSVGAEAKLAAATELDINAYYNAMDPILFDLAVNPTASDVQQPQPTHAPWSLPSATNGGRRRVLDNLFKQRVGRSYGIEVLLRRRQAQHLFGWVSYTLSRSERQSDQGFILFDFDRLHVLNVVAGLELPRNWEFGSRVLFQTGTPLTTFFGTNSVRGDSQFRVDLRLDKRAVWNNWLLDFYVDIINTTVAAESGGLVGANSIRYVVPTIGFRAVL